ncbi:hypothetical protein [Rathayibacter toxicus]|uniref:hypothetical protein n=1 Tax=Rathayibacter toxicus TaxID=145458 RepID=UPI001C059C3F|nr:hypothetical protein [Rathayibacter toxicus]QWL30551.1 hypothetical protein E2R34_07275 [Rathayibacter toxicus]
MGDGREYETEADGRVIGVFGVGEEAGGVVGIRLERECPACSAERGGKLFRTLESRKVVGYET